MAIPVVAFLAKVSIDVVSKKARREAALALYRRWAKRYTRTVVPKHTAAVEADLTKQLGRGFATAFSDSVNRNVGY